jgi:hypothetical protein
MNNRGKSPREITKLLVWARAAGRCQFENCRKSLDHELISGTPDFNSAYLAHIVASSPRGKRGHPELSHVLADNADNIMLMCDEHHRVIDGEQTAGNFSVNRLQQMKKDHEEWVDTSLSSGPDSRSHILQFSAPIGPNETAVPFDDCVAAIMPQRTPAERLPIEMKIRGMRYKDSDPTYWDVQTDTLRSDFIEKIKGRFDNGGIWHLSIFGLAPIPLLMELGRLIPDISAADVFERHRDPQQWAWPEDGQEVHFSANQGSADVKKVALKLSITSEIEDERIISALEGDISIWEIRSHINGPGIIRSRSDLSRYRTIVRTTLDEIKNKHGMDVDLSVFPAIPVSCAVEFGRVWQPKAHPGFDIYDQAGQSGFKKRLSFLNE